MFLLCKQRQPLVCKETVSELLRVLAYPTFPLTVRDQQNLLEDFLPYADVVILPRPWPALPVCRDPKDQMFLVLAQVGQADALITGDHDILALSHVFPGLIITPDTWLGLRSGLSVHQPAVRYAKRF